MKGMNDDLVQMRLYIDESGHETLQYRQRRATATMFGDPRIYNEWTEWTGVPIVRAKAEGKE